MSEWTRRWWLVAMMFVPACGSSESTPAGPSDASTSSGDGAAGDSGPGPKDGGGDSSATDGGVTDGAVACPSYDDNDKACKDETDCAMIARGCYCGAQPVIGISKTILPTATACEKKAGSECALGCANFPGQVAEDGKNNVDGGTIAVKCDLGKCHTVLQ